MNELPLEDKEVGELWKQSSELHLSLRWDVVLNLIRKLVEERAETTQMNLPEGSKWTWGDCINDALRDFGIDPETWGKTEIAG